MNNEIENTIRLLQTQVTNLEKENARLLGLVNSYASNAEKNEMAKHYVASLVHGIEPISPRLGYNLKHARSGQTFQIQFSKVQEGNRWQWTRVTDPEGMTKYDQLILIGAVMLQFADQYKDRRSQYVLFDIPALEVARLTNAERAITSGVNPLTSNTSVAKSLFSRYQLTSGEMSQRYGSSIKI